MTETEAQATPNLLRNLLLNEIKEPVYFKGLISDWEILSWDLTQWVEKLGDKPLPFRSGVKKNTPIPQWERTCQVSNLTMREFTKLLNEMDVNSKVNTNWFYFDYKYMHEWFHDNPDILNVIDWKTFGFPEVKGDQSTIWIGSDGAHTPCHFDSYGCNLVAQVFGMKQWILFPPETSCSLLPTRVPYEESSVYSKLNFFTPNMKLMKDLEKAWVITLNPGDVLFVPPQWWHYVENIGTAISVNTWLPLATDFERRLEESLVKLLMSQLTKEISDYQNILNPNEDETRNCTIGESAAILETAMKQFYEQQFKKQSQSTEKEGPIPKRSRTTGNTMGDSEENNNALLLFKSLSQAVPIMLGEQLMELFTSKSIRFKSEDHNNSLTKSPESLTIEKVINAVCHPDTMSCIKVKLLQEFFPNNLS